MRISAVAAIGEKRELGVQNTLLWHIPLDLQRFKQITLHHPVIMGRRTYESVGRLLPQRKNIIISGNRTFLVPGGVVTHSLDEAITEARRSETEEMFIIGGATIFTQSLPRVQRLYLTIVHQTFPQADAFFPDYTEFTKVSSIEDHNSDGYNYTFVTLERNIT